MLTLIYSVTDFECNHTLKIRDSTLDDGGKITLKCDGVATSANLIIKGPYI